MTLEVEPSGWDELLAREGCTDAYYLRGYTESAAVTQSGRSAYLYLRRAHGAVVFPCVVRELSALGVRDVTTVGYGGPLALGEDPPLREFSALYDQWCARHAVVTTFVRFHPLFANHRYALESFECERIGGTVSWLLGDDLSGGMHRHHRRLVRKAAAAGIDVRVAVGPDRLDDFALLYEQTMRRVDASSFYFFPDDYWPLLAAGLGEKLLLFDALLEGRVLGSILCFATPPWLHYHLGATSDEARELGVSHLLLYTAARYGRERGYLRFHLGSGVGTGGGSLLEFKQRFSPTPLIEQWLGKAVHDIGRYLEMTGTRSVGYEGFFPAYRR